MKWQPIETAPKDGTFIDIYTADGRRYTDVQYRADETNPGWYHEEGWAAALDGMDAQRATHWMKVRPPEDT